MRHRYPYPVKWCGYCVSEKPVEDFYVRKDGRQSGNLSSYCKRCVALLTVQRRKSVLGDAMINSAKNRANKKGLPFDLDLYRGDIAARIERGCELTGFPFTVDGPRDWDSPSIDRVRPERGYVYDNIRIILWGLNSAFGYWGEDNAELFVRAWLERKST